MIPLIEVPQCFRLLTVCVVCRCGSLRHHFLREQIDPVPSSERHERPAVRHQSHFLQEETTETNNHPGETLQWLITAWETASYQTITHPYLTLTLLKIYYEQMWQIHKVLHFYILARYTSLYHSLSLCNLHLLTFKTFKGMRSVILLANWKWFI